MKCRNCQTELEAGKTVCPNCGADNMQPPETETKGTGGNALKIVLATVAGIVLLALLVWVVYYGITGNVVPWGNKETESTESTGGTEDYERPTGGVYTKDSYTADTSNDEKLQVFLSQMDTVVATMGDNKLTNSQLQIFYWMNVYDYLSQAGKYGYSIPDTSKPLSEQVCNKTTGQTWEQYFLEMTLDVWYQYQLMTNDANAADFKLPEKYLEDFRTLEEDLAETAESEGYDSVEAFLAGELGAGATIQSYRNYLMLYYTASLYYDDLAAKAEVTEKEAQEYFANNVYDLYYYYHIAAASGKLVDVRHILILPEGGTKDPTTGKTTYSEAEWETCREKAQEIYDAWLAGDAVTEQTFAELAKKHSKDGNASEGGLYTDVYEGQMVEAFHNWCFDESRQTGDHGLVKTPYGYHIMYFVQKGEGINPLIREELQNQKASARLQELIKGSQMTVEYESIVLAGAQLDKK